MTDSDRSRWGWTVLRLVLALIVGIHGVYRAQSGTMPLFAGWLATQGIPLPLAVAWGVTLVEIAGAALLLAGRWLVLPATLLLAAIYAVGIVLVHAPAGWFVVGAGRNGAEFSVLLIAALLCVGAQHPLRRR